MCGSLSSLWWLEEPEMQPRSVRLSSESESLQSWTVAHWAPLSMGFSRQEYWSGLPFPSPGDLPDPGTESCSPTLQADSLLSEPQGKQLSELPGKQDLFVCKGSKYVGLG